MPAPWVPGSRTTASLAGYAVHLLDNNEEGLERGATTFANYLKGVFARGKISNEKMAQGIERLSITTDYGDIGDADLVIEAVFENMTVKKEVFENSIQCARPGRFSRRTRQPSMWMKLPGQQSVRRM